MLPCTSTFMKPFRVHILRYIQTPGKFNPSTADVEKNYANSRNLFAVKSSPILCSAILITSDSLLYYMGSDSIDYFFQLLLNLLIKFR